MRYINEGDVALFSIIPYECAAHTHSLFWVQTMCHPKTDISSRRLTFHKAFGPLLHKHAESQPHDRKQNISLNFEVAKPPQ